MLHALRELDSKLLSRDGGRHLSDDLAKRVQILAPQGHVLRLERARGRAGCASNEANSCRKPCTLLANTPVSQESHERTLGATN